MMQHVSIEVMTSGRTKISLLYFLYWKSAFYDGDLMTMIN